MGRLGWAAATLLAIGLAVFAATAFATTPDGYTSAVIGHAASRWPIATISGCRVTATTSATELTCALSGARVRTIKNCGTAAIDLGASGVTTGTGYSLAVGETMNINPGFDGATGSTLAVYGITSAATQVVCVLEGK